jgi:hypothetical protein
MSQQWNFSLQHKLPASLMVDVTYSGNHGTHLMAGGYDYNQMDPKYYSYGPSLPNEAANAYAGVRGVVNSPKVTLAQSLRPYPYLLGIGVRNPSLGNSIYHAVLISVEKRMSHGLTILASFTGGKLISDSVVTPFNWFGEQVAITGYQNGKYHRNWERAVDPTDVSRRLVLSGIYELPFGRGKAWDPGNRVVSRLVGGWQLNSITTLQTGLPLRIAGASNYLADRPNSTGQSARLDSRTRDRWFDTSAFFNPPIYTYGNVGRVLPNVRAPGTFELDLSVLKATAITEKVRLQFRAEAFNLPNFVNLGIPNTGFSAGADGKNNSSTFGMITSARDPRQVQLGMKLIF